MSATLIPLCLLRSLAVDMLLHQLQPFELVIGKVAAGQEAVGADAGLQSHASYQPLYTA